AAVPDAREVRNGVGGRCRLSADEADARLEHEGQRQSGQNPDRDGKTSNAHGEQAPSARASKAPSPLCTLAGPYYRRRTGRCLDFSAAGTDVAKAGPARSGGRPNVGPTAQVCVRATSCPSATCRPN